MSEQPELKSVRQAENQATENTRREDNAGSDRRPLDSDEAARSTAGQAAANPASVAELEARARAAEQQARELRSRYEELRGGLERQTEETRLRLNRAADERALGSKMEFVSALLPVLDNLQRSIEAALANGSEQSLLHGLERTVQGFERALARIGVEPVGSVGEPFDPSVHEAIDTVAVGQEKDGVVTHEYSRGYQLGDRLLRPARVRVGRAA